MWLDSSVPIQLLNHWITAACVQASEARHGVTRVRRRYQTLSNVIKRYQTWKQKAAKSSKNKLFSFGEFSCKQRQRRSVERVLPPLPTTWEHLSDSPSQQPPATAMTDAAQLNIDFRERGRRAWWISICWRPYFTRPVWLHLPNCHFSLSSRDWFFIKAHIYPWLIHTLHHFITQTWCQRVEEAASLHFTAAAGGFI